MEEATTAVVENILAMVGKIHQGRPAILCFERRDDSVKQRIRVHNSIVIGIDKFIAVGTVGLGISVGCEHRAVGRIPFVIVEVRAVGVQHNEEFVAWRFIDETDQHRHQFCIIVSLRVIVEEYRRLRFTRKEIDE